MTEPNAGDPSGPGGPRGLPGESALQGGAWTASRDLESLYNDGGQQRGGVLLGLLRIVPEAHSDHPVVRALRRGPFNMNPILAGYVLAPLARRLARPISPEGAISSAEATADAPADASVEREDEAAVEQARELLAPVVSGLGDRLFWGGVRPGLSLVTVLGWVLWIGQPAAWYWLGYNAIQWHWRRRAWRTGLAGEAAVRRELAGPTLRRWIAVTNGAGRFLLGGAIGVVVTWLWMRDRLGPRESARGVIPLVFLGCLALGFVLARRGRPGSLALGWIALLVAGLAALVRQGLGDAGH